MARKPYEPQSRGVCRAVHRRKSLTELWLALRLESPQNFSEYMNMSGARSLSIALV
jgi:hypothetical protein